jgi:hypothetical protein
MSTFAAPGTYLQELVLATATTDQKIACVSVARVGEVILELHFFRFL